MDGMRLEWQSQNTWSIASYAGVPRFPEIGDFHKDDGLISGISLLTHTTHGLAGQVGVVYRKRDMQTNNWLGNDQMFGISYLQYRFDKINMPTFYSGVEYDISGSSLDQLTSGVEWSPHRILSLNGELNYFDENTTEGKETIFALFTGGKMWQGRLGFNEKPFNDFDFFQNYNYSRVKDPGGTNHNQHDLLMGITYSLPKIDIDITPSFNYTQSYGGKVYLGSLALLDYVKSWWSVLLRYDYAKFSKITNDNGEAMSAVVWNTFELPKDFSLSLNTEFHKNNDVSREFRGGLALNWNFGSPSFPAAGQGMLQ